VGFFVACVPEECSKSLEELALSLAGDHRVADDFERRNRDTLRLPTIGSRSSKMSRDPVAQRCSNVFVNLEYVELI
jgi:hypothetical protein